MKKIIAILVVVAVMLGAVAVYVFVLGGGLPFGLTLPGQPDADNSQLQGTDAPASQEQESLSIALTELFSSPLIINDGEIIGFGDIFPLLSSASGLYTFAPYFPAKNMKIAGFDCGRPMTVYFDYDANYYCAVRPAVDLVYQLLNKGLPHYRIFVSENGSMSSELLIAEDVYGYRFELVTKERIETKSAVTESDVLASVMTDIYNETASELAVSKKLFESVTGGLCFKELINLDYGFIVNADIRAYDPVEKRITLFPRGGLCITDITVSKKTSTNRSLLKRVGPIGADSYYLAYRQPLSGNVVISLPDGESYLYITISGAGDVSDAELYEFMLSVLFIDYAGDFALMESQKLMMR